MKIPHKMKQAVGITAITAATLGGLSVFLRGTHLGPEDHIRYLGQRENGESRVAVIDADLSTELIFNKDGYLVDTNVYRNATTAGNWMSRPKMDEVVRAAQQDFPVGVELTRMLDASQTYQRCFTYEEKLKSAFNGE